MLDRCTTCHELLGVESWLRAELADGECYDIRVCSLACAERLDAWDQLIRGWRVEVQRSAA